MSDYYVMSEDELKKDLEDYIKNCHNNADLRDDVMLLLRKFHARARCRFVRKQNNGKYKTLNLWSEFSNPKKKESNRETISNSEVPASLSEPTQPERKAKLVISDIKGAFRRHIEKTQKNRCCYCRRWLSNSGYSKPIEHILPRETYEQYSFHFRNLSVACVDCNGLKKQKDWSDKSSLNNKDYPSPESFTHMFHPQFHRYDDHVRFIRVQTNDHNITVYRGVTPQGKKLCDDLLKIIAGKELIVNANPALKSSMETIAGFDVMEGSELEVALQSLVGALSDRSVQRLTR